MSNLIPQYQLNTDTASDKPILSSATYLRAMKKVPEVTVYFWIIKVLTTAMGETTSDYLVTHINPIIAVALGGIGLAVALVLQFSMRRYVPGVYWFTVVMVAIFGTMAADVLHVGLGIPYFVSTAFFMVALVVIFAIWYTSEKTLSIHSIYTHRREMFYWAAVMTTFALGTAAGDMTAITLGLGYFSSGVMFAVLIAVPALAYWLLGLNEIFAFWLAYILTRPLGASFADWIGRSHKLGGLGLGTGAVSLCLTILIVGFVSYLSITRKDIKGNNDSLLRH
ncbi:MAG: membrane protein [Ktedonobacteraceae bacterium]